MVRCLLAFSVGVVTVTLLVAATSVHFSDNGKSIADHLTASFETSPRSQSPRGARSLNASASASVAATASNKSSSAESPAAKKSRFLFDLHGLHSHEAHYGHDIGFRSEHYWLIPLIIVIGCGALLLPMLSVLTTALVSSGAITLTAGRKKREVERIFASMQPNALSDTMASLLSQVEKAFEKFGADINSKYKKF